MPTLVSHPDEVRVLSRRFGQGAANIDKYIELDGYKAVQKAIAEGPEKMAGWIIDTMKAIGSARARWCGLSDRHEVVVCAEDIGEAEVCAG